MARQQNNLADPPSPLARPPFVSNISNLKVVVDGDVLGATVSFNVVALTNTAIIVLLRSFTNSILAATQLEVVPNRIGPQSYDDRAAAIVGKQVWYWLQLQNGNDRNLNVGPVTTVVQSATASHAVNWISASSNFSGDGSVQVNVVCELFPGADASGGVVVFVKNYQGNPANVLIFQDTKQVLTFHLKITREAVLLSVAAVNTAGVLSALSARVGVTLNGRPTNPARLTGLTALEGNKFTQISFSASPEPGITLYRLYRGPFGGTFGQAAVVATIAPTTEAQYSIKDPTVNGHASTYQWFVTSVNAVGESDPSDAIVPATPWI